MKAAVLVLMVACVPSSRTAELECDVSDDCSGGRVCERGFCVAQETDASVDGDAGADVPTDADPFDCTMFHGRHFDACAIPRPRRELVLDQAGTYTYSTTTNVLLSPANQATIVGETTTVASGRLLSITKLTIAAGATLRVTGDQPLIIAAWSTIGVAGAIDASSTANTPDGRGAGAGATSCVAAVAGQNTNGGAGGGGGGGFGGAGGTGGRGGGGNGGKGGTAITAPLLAGGCAGANGGVGDTAGNNGVGGAGGGAVQLTALDSITIDGVITAGGQGGTGAASSDGGGGGGGSGGMIGLEASTVTISPAATLAANGGAGGGGSGGGLAGTGQNGNASAAAATGGGGNNGGNGGNGAAAAAANGNNGNNDGDGAGGAGGGEGFVVIASTNAAQLTGATVSAVVAQPTR